MLRSICLLLCAAWLAASAHAASLSVNSDKLTYLVGETVTLMVIADDGGAYSYGIFGRLDYSGALVNNGTRSQQDLVGTYGKWVQGVLLQGDDGINANSFAFNQIAPPFAQDTITNLPADNPLSTITLIAQAVGIVSVKWHTAPDGMELDFFGLMNAPGTSFTIVPEPATLALICIGLLALTMPSRERGRS